MERYEYKVIPAPEKGLKAKGIKTPADRFAHALELAMNELGIDGWEYWRAECLPVTERSGLTSSKVTERHLLVFRRALEPVPDLPTRRIVTDPPQPVVAEPEFEPVEEAAEAPRMPVFTRRMEMAREQREELMRSDDEMTLRRDPPED